VSSCRHRRIAVLVEQDAVMSEDVVVLDLNSDDPHHVHPPERVRLREVRLRLWAVPVAMIVAVVPAVALTRAWDAEQARQARQRTVSLIVSVAPDAELNGGSSADEARFRSTLKVLNIGPLPITVDAVASTEGGLSLTASGLDSVVSPGMSRDVGVDLLQECVRWLRTEPLMPLELRLDVTTADGARRAQLSYLALRETVWREVLERSCRS
jgi:hypothetical protein